MTAEDKSKRYVMYEEIGYGNTYVESTFLRNAMDRVLPEVVEKMKVRVAEKLRQDGDVVLPEGKA